MPRRRRLIRYPFLVAILSLAVAIGLYVLGLPHLQARGESNITPVDLYIPRAIDVLVFTWCFWVGSSVGSFLNVVAWRMPRGEGINGRSHCPRCRAQLRARDNLPVFGWLSLGGRCYNCRLPISIRYPLVEAAVGVTITAICLGELFQVSLPRQSMLGQRGPLRAPVVDLPILATLVYHVVVLSSSWAFGLIRLDGNRLPRKLLIFAAITTLVPMMVYPTLMVVPWKMSPPMGWEPDWKFVDATLRVISGLAAATVLGRYLARAFCPSADPKLDPLGQSTARLMDLIAILAIPGVVLGWQALIAVTVVASLLAALIGRVFAGFKTRLIPDALGRFSLSIPVAMALQITFWRYLHAPVADGFDKVGFPWWPSDGGSPWVLLLWGGALMLIPVWLRDREIARALPPATTILDDDDDENEEGDPPSEGDIGDVDPSRESTHGESVDSEPDASREDHS